VVITHQKDYKAPSGVEIFSSIDAALAKHAGEDIFIIGGEQIFRQTLGIANTLYITRVYKDYDGDTFFPAIEQDRWKEVAKEDHDSFSFLTYTRI
jgi:dihydrofolate reductase